MGSGWAPSAGQEWRQVMGKDGPANGELSAICSRGFIISQVMSLSPVV